MALYFKPPQNSGNRRRGVYDDMQGGPVTPVGSTQGQQVSQEADQTIGGIDDVLAQYEKDKASLGQGSSESEDGGSDGDDKKKSDSPDDLRKAEEKGNKKDEGEEKSGVLDKVGGGAAAVAGGKLGFVAKGVKGLLAKDKRGKTLAIGGGFIGLMGLIFGGLMMTLPFKTLHMSLNLENIYFASVNQASQEMVENLLHHYYLNHVIPGMLGKEGCTTTRVDKSCARVGNAKTLPGALYRIWQQQNIEGKLANDPEIKLEVHREGNRYWVSSVWFDKDIELGKYDPNNTKQFGDRMAVALNRQGMRQVKTRVLENYTGFKRIIMWKSIGSWFDYKHATRRCIMVCTYKDGFDDWKDGKTHAFRIFLVERVLLPRADVMGLVFECALTSFDCTKAGPADQNGEQKSKFETDMRVRLAAHQAKFGEKSLEELERDADTVRAKGFMYYIFERVAGKTAAAVAYKAIPVIGWIDLGARIYYTGSHVGPALQKMNYIMNTVAMIQFYQVIRTNADELKTGHVNPGDMTSMAAAFDRNPKADQGGGGAQDSPSYNALMHYGNPDVQTAFNWNGGKVFAEKSIARCNHGTYKPGKIFCPEVSNDAESDTMMITRHISTTAKSGAGVVPDFVSGLWLKTFGAALDFIGSVTIGQFIKFMNYLANTVTKGEFDKYMAEIFTWFVEKLAKFALISPIGDNDAGSRNWELLACGANAAGNDAARFVQGGQVLTPSQLADIRASQLKQRRADFQDRPLYARVLDRRDSMSLVSRVADAAPTSSGDTSTLVTSVASGLMRTASAGLASTILPDKAFANIRQTPDPCGITQYGWPKDARVLHEDPEKTWEENNCGDPEQVRIHGDKAQTINPLNQMNEQLEGNPCLLIKNAVSGAGGQWDSDLLQSFGAQAASSTTTDPAGDGKWHWPSTEKFRPGPCWNAKLSYGYHAGMDMNAEKSGTMAKAMHDGVVEKVGEDGAAGHYVSVKVSGSDNLYYNYQHLIGSSIKVKAGDPVTGGVTEIGVVGTSGRSPSNQGHLHIVINHSATSLGSYSSSPQSDTEDPMKYLPSPAPHGYKCG